MNTGLSAEQRLLRDTTRRFLAQEMPLTEVRQLSESGAGLDRKWWKRAADIGWTTMLAPAELGGGDGDLGTLTKLMEEVGRGVAPGPILSTNVVLVALGDEMGRASANAETSASIVGGESVGTWAVYEPGVAGWNPLQAGVRARASEGGFRLVGVKDRVEAAGDADHFLVTAQVEQRLGEFIVPRSAEGVSVSATRCLDSVRRFGVVTFDDVWLPGDALVGDPDVGEQMIARQANVAGVLQLAETAGAVARVFEFSLEWLFGRYSFGRPLASYQTVKHRMAKHKVALESMHAIVGAATSAVEAGHSDAAQLVSVAKSYVADIAVQVVQDCVQLHGAIGVTWEHDLHLYLRRITLNRALYGTPEEHRRQVVDLAGAANG